MNFNRTYTMDIEDVINKISQGVPVYMKLHDGTLICINDIALVSRYDCWINNGQTLRYLVYIRHPENAKPISIIPEDYEILKKYLTII